jgi:ABC-2 type transport system permease protein
VRAAWAIAWREWRSFFRVPLGWIAIAFYLLLTGYSFARNLEPGAPASMQAIFGLSGFFLLLVAPAVSMRLLSEELRSGTIEPLMTAPVPDAAIIAGKFLGGALFLACMIGPTIAYALVLLRVAEPRPDPGPIVAGYISLLLVGSLYLSVGMLASALTSSQALAFLTAFLTLAGLWIFTSSADNLPPRLARVAAAVALQPRISDFARGVIDTAHVVFFVAGTAWFLVLAYVALQARRWR